MKIRFLDDRDEWNKWALGCDNGNLLQSFEWGEFKAGFGWHPVRLAVEDNGRIVGGVQMLLRHLPIGTVAYAPRGPLVNFSDIGTSEFLLSEMHKAVRKEGAIVLKIEPEILSSPTIESFLREHGFMPSAAIQPRSTMIVDLTEDIDTIISRLNIKTRYNIGLAKRKGVCIREGTADDLPTFYQLLCETGQRSGFSIHGPNYYELAWRTLDARGMAGLLVAERDGSPMAMSIMFASGKKAYYMYSASHNENRNLKPNDFLLWECIKWAHSKGCRTCDLWGIPDEIGEAVEHGLSLDGDTGEEINARVKSMLGVYRFKRGFGGEIVRYGGAYDYVYSHVRYWLYLTGVYRIRPMITMATARRQTLEGV